MKKLAILQAMFALMLFTFSACSEDTTDGPRQFDVQPGQLFNVVMLQEDIARGQRVERFRVEITSDGSTWETIAQGITIGHKRLVKLDTPRTARNLRVTIEQTRRTANLSNVGLYYAK